MKQKPIILVTCGHFEQRVIKLISEDITNVFQHPVENKECSLDINKHYNPGRRQYDANGILEYITSLAPEQAIKVIGLYRVDLYIPVLTYIFGQAILNGKTGLVSLYRLRNELYGLERNNDLQIERFRKVIIHELGHMFGLIHCHQTNCVMRSSSYVEDIDQKNRDFCNNCKILLQEKL